HFFQCVERVAEVVEHAHEQYVVELFSMYGLDDLIDVGLFEFDVEAELVSGEGGLAQVDRIVVDAEDSVGAAPFHLEGIEAAVAADIEDGLAAQVVGYGVFEELPEVR